MNAGILGFLGLLCVGTVAAADRVILSEFIAVSDGGLRDEDGEESDWIEIQNIGVDPVNLEGWHLTDDVDDLTRWTFPSKTLVSGEFLIVFASGKDRSNTARPLHTNFRLEGDGEYLALVRPDGVTVAQAYSPGFPSQIAGISYGVIVETIETETVLSPRYFPTPTPGFSNSTAYLGRVADTKFSTDRGFYNAPFEVWLSCETPGAEIRFTLDGSEPRLTSGLVFTGPISVRKTTLLRAVAFKTGYQPSNVDTHTYLFLDDVVRQSLSTATNQGFPASIRGAPINYTMDPKVIGPNDQFGGKYAASIRDDLRSLPTVSLVMNRDDWFGGSGLFPNSDGEGFAWERAVSTEILYPDAQTGRNSEQVNAGVRINGNSSRRLGHWKHSFRVVFRERYGRAEWHHPIFGSYSNAIDRFETLILRGGAQDAWSLGLAGNRALYTRDAFLRETLLAMQAAASHQQFVHLYLNGLYWGLYEIIERPDDAFSAAYLGGVKDDWATVQSGFPGGGELEYWDQLLAHCRAGLADNRQYFAVQGRNPDGTPNPAATNHLNVDNLIDYMIAEIYVLNVDWPHNNYWLARERTPPSGGFRFYPWDGEMSLDLGFRPTFDFTSVEIGVAEPYAACRKNLEFRVRFSDHVQQHFFEGGALYADPVHPLWDPAKPHRNVPAARFNNLCASIERAIVAESARWGQLSTNVMYTRDEHWAPHRQFVLTDFLSQRSGYVLQHFRQAGLFPSLSAPILSQPGGAVPAGLSVTITNSNPGGGTILYTLDTSDPRLIGGAINPTAISYSSPIVINSPLEIRSRVRQGTNWSALTRARYQTPQDFRTLVITELMYHPAGLAGWDGDEFEFIELKNTGSTILRLDGLRFVEGIDYAFTNGTALAPGGFWVLARNPPAFSLRYPGVAVNGVYGGKLDNSGESLQLAHSFGTELLTTSYGDRSPWPVTADGFGFSLVRAEAGEATGNGVTWRASARSGGSPGADDPSPAIAKIVINEIRTASVAPERDAIELFNASTISVDLGGWYLTDDPDIPAKYRIPSGTTLAPGDYAVFDEAAFNAFPGVGTSFSLRAEGDEVYLFSADPGRGLTGYSHGYSFGASEPGASLGRIITSIGEDELTRQIAPSFGQANPGPEIGPVVINEIHYHPAPGDDEFVELRNLSTAAVDLFAPGDMSRPWRLNGIGFTFPPGTSLPGNGLLVVAAGDPDRFRMRYGVPPNVPVFGPVLGFLQDDGERLELQKPGPPDTNSSTAYIDVDAVRYEDRAPWSPAADGAGASLQRKSPVGYANEPLAWNATTPTPGREYTAGAPPIITEQPSDRITVFGGEVLFSARVDGPGPLSFQWAFNGNPLPQATNRFLGLTNVQYFQGGRYQLFVFNPGGFAASDSVTLTVLRGPDVISVPTNVAVHIRPDPRAAPTTNVTFRVLASSSTRLRYQWRFAGIAIPGATNVSFTVANVQLAHEGWYSVGITDDNGTTFTPGAYLQPLISPEFILSPLSQRVPVGSPFVLSAVVSGHPRIFSFAWRHGSTYLQTNANAGETNFFRWTATNRPATQILSVVVRNLANSSPGVLSASANIVTLADQDADGLPDEWETSFGLDPATPGDGTQDRDGDGLSEAKEFVAGTHPLDAQSTLRLGLHLTEDATALSFAAVSNRTYRIEFSEGLAHNAWHVLADIPAQSTNRMATVPDLRWPTSRFYRVNTPVSP